MAYDIFLIHELGVSYKFCSPDGWYTAGGSGEVLEGPLVSTKVVWLLVVDSFVLWLAVSFSRSSTSMASISCPSLFSSSELDSSILSSSSSEGL